MDVPAAIEGVSVREFARKIGVSHVTVLRWLRDGYITRRPADGLIDPAAAEAALASWGLPRHRFEAGGGAEVRLTLAQALAWPFTAEAEAAVAEVVDDLLRPIDD